MWEMYTVRRRVCSEGRDYTFPNAPLSTHLRNSLFANKILTIIY